MEDVVEAPAGGKAVIWINSLQPPDSQEHSDWRAEGKEGLRLEDQLRVVDGYLQDEAGQTVNTKSNSPETTIYYIIKRTEDV